MPLVIAIIVIIFVFVKIHENKLKSEKIGSIREKDRRKTNAAMERSLVDYYMKHGFSFDDAFRKSYEDMTMAGYEPCIPKGAYSHNADGVQSSHCHCSHNIREYDSFLVQQRRNTFLQYWKDNHHGESPPDDIIDKEVYQNFPKTEEEYLHDLKVLTVKAQAVPVGECVIYPGLGTCEVVGHIISGTRGIYKLRVLSSGNIVTSVKIGDPRIQRQGRF